MKLPNLSFKKFKISQSGLHKFLLWLAVGVVLSSLYHAVYAHRIIPGVKIGSVKVGGMTYEHAKQVLQDFEKKTAPNLVFNFEGKRFAIEGAAINLTYNWDASVSRAYEVGRTGNILVDTKDKLAGLIKPIFIAAFYEYDEDLFHTRTSQIKGEINKEGSDAHFVIAAPGQLDSVEAVEGREVDSQALFSMIINAFNRESFEQKDLPVRKVEPTILKSDIDPFLAQAKKIIFNTLVIKNDKKRWILNSNQMLEFLSFEKIDGKPSLTLNVPTFSAYLETLAQEVNMPPRGKVTQTDGDKVLGFEITQAGRDIDQRVFTKSFKVAYFSAMPSVDLILKDIAGGNKEQYGIFSLLGEGKSKFAESITPRIHNLSLATTRVNGVLVPPGGIFSMNNAVGEISGATGYDAALIIQNGRTVFGEGGGVCQTSTTMFRAALNAGLPIVMRYPHAYRVHYYEEDSPPGFDASIYQPSLDFQFKNDTPNYILIQTSVDLANVSLSYKIYGTPDGRSVEITEPVVTNQTPPPPALYQDDSTLAKGITRQVDWAVWGANVSFSRTVRRAGQVLHTETFASRYQPWRAIFMVGTKK